MLRTGAEENVSEAQEFLCKCWRIIWSIRCGDSTVFEVVVTKGKCLYRDYIEVEETSQQEHLRGQNILVYMLGDHLIY
jgi:hypothetical protein